MSASSPRGGVTKTPGLPRPTNNASPPPASNGFNARTLWPDLIETPGKPVGFRVQGNY